MTEERKTWFEPSTYATQKSKIRVERLQNQSYKEEFLKLNRSDSGDIIPVREKENEQEINIFSPIYIP